MQNARFRTAIKTVFQNVRQFITAFQNSAIKQRSQTYYILCNVLRFTEKELSSTEFIWGLLVSLHFATISSTQQGLSFLTLVLQSNTSCKGSFEVSINYGQQCDNYNDRRS